MPTYDFACGTCGGFRVVTSIEHRSAPRACPRCGAGAERVPAAPSLALMPSVNRHAELTHERSRHQPRLARADSAAVRLNADAGAPKSFPGRRPWMISH